MRPSCDRRSVRFDYPDREAEPETVAAFGRELHARLAALPGSERVALGSDTPFEGTSSATVVSSESLRPDPTAPYGGAVRVYGHRISEGFFATLGVPLLYGRDFGPEDVGDEPSAVVVSDALARRLWPGENPLGQRLRFGPPDRVATDRESGDWLTVAGVVGDVRYRDLVAGDDSAPQDPDLYLPLRPASYRNLAVAVKTRGEPSEVIAAVRREVRDLAPGVPLYALETIDQRLASETARSSFSALLLGLFAGLALVLAGIGIYGVMAYTVGHRAREIGVRMALGAPRRRVLALVIGQGMTLVLAGSLLGLLVARLATRLLASQVYGVSTTAPGVYLAMTAALVAVALLACYLPARRASRVEPVTALRDA